MDYSEKLKLERKKGLVEAKEMVKELLLEAAKRNVKVLMGLEKPSLREHEDLGDEEIDILRAYFYAFDEHGLNDKRKEAVRFFRKNSYNDEYRDAFEKLNERNMFTLTDYLIIEELGVKKGIRRRPKTLRALENLKGIFDEIGWNEEARLKVLSNTTKEDKIKERFRDLEERFGVKIIFDRGYLLSATQKQYDAFLSSVYRKMGVIKEEFPGNVPDTFDVRINPDFASYNPAQFKARLREYKESLEEILLEDVKTLIDDDANAIRDGIILILSTKGLIGGRYTPRAEIVRYVGNNNGKKVIGVIKEMTRDGVLQRHKGGDECYSLDPSSVVDPLKVK